MEKNAFWVLFGGCSTEYGVSLQSAYAVLSALDRGALCRADRGHHPRGRVAVLHRRGGEHPRRHLAAG